MKAFIDMHEDRIHGVLSCFDRMLFRGYLPIMSDWSMAQLLQAHEVDCSSVKPFLLANAGRVKAHAVALARKHGRPFEYLSARMRKEDAARKMVERDDIDEGLVSATARCAPGATEVMNFLGRKLVGNFRGEVVSDLSSLVCRRVGGSRIKHRVKQNGLKRYDNAGLVLRVETVINKPEEFRVRKQVLRDGKQRAEWAQLRKGVAYLFRYREVSLQANARYLDALAVVDDPTKGKQALQRLTTTKKDVAGRSCPGFNPMAQDDATLFKSLMDGEHSLRGFTNRDFRSRLTTTRWLRSCADDPKKASAKVGRCFRRLHAHGLIAKIPRTRRWRVTAYGHQAMGAPLYLREHHFPNVYATAPAA